MYSESYIPARIKERRIALKLSQIDVARKIAVDDDAIDTLRSQISSWENGKRIPELTTLCNLCNALDCDIEYLLGAIEAPHRATHDAVEYTGLDKDAVDVAHRVKEAGGIMGLDILSRLIKSSAFWNAIANINYARFASDNTTRAMSEGLSEALTQLQIINAIERHPGATVLSPEQMRDMNLYQAAQKFSMCITQIVDRESERD